jgi:ribonuclease E
LQPADHAQPEPAQVSAPEHHETAQEAERAAARRRSTVREKVSFLSSAQPDAAAPAAQTSHEPAAATPAPDAPASEPAGDGQPRKAGWWSRRFGNGE